MNNEKISAKKASEILLFVAPKLNLTDEEATACLLGSYAIDRLDFIKEVIGKDDLSDGEKLNIIKFHAFAMENGTIFL